MRNQLLLVCPLLLATSAAWALPVCTTATLDVYTANDANSYSCTLAGLTFSNFAYLSASGLPTEASVSVIPTSDATGDVGFIFDGAFTASAGSSSSALLAYTITSSSANILGATSALISYGASGAGAMASINETLCTTGSTGACTPASNLYPLSVFDDADHPPAVQSASVSFTTAATTVRVSKTIAEVGGSGSATISSFENTVQLGAVPEPASFFTMGSGLILASLFLRRKLGASKQ